MEPENRSARKSGSFWPETHLAKCLVRAAFICEKQCDPPSPAPVVTFPRLEIPLAGVYQTRCLRNGAIQDLSLRPGTALFVPPGCWNSPKWQRNVRVLCLQFEQTRLAVNVTLVQRKKRPQFSEGTFAFAAPVTGPIPHILGAMLEWQSSGEDPEVLSALTRALIQCVQFLAPPRHVKNRRRALFESVCAYLEDNYRQGVTRDTVARLFHVSPGHLSQLFRRYTKMRFVDYLTNIRIGRGKYLLRTERFKLEDIASRVGFCDAAYFCRLFKKFTQTTPVEYRARVLRPPNHLRMANDLQTPSGVRELMRGTIHSIPVPFRR